jgi:hypothetical protein
MKKIEDARRFIAFGCVCEYARQVDTWVELVKETTQRVKGHQQFTARFLCRASQRLQNQKIQ